MSWKSSCNRLCRKWVKNLYYKNIKKTLILYTHRIQSVLGCGDGSKPCNPGGGSPSLHTAITRVTGPLFTGRDCLLGCYCGMTSLKSISTLVGVPRRVERPSLEICSKGNLSLPQPTILQFLNACVFKFSRNNFFLKLTLPRGMYGQ